MGKTVSIGNQDFSSIRENGSFYVDKTAFIKEWWDNQDVVTLITRPRRFGKTLNMSMLEKFFSNRFAGRSDLFEGLSIWKDEGYRGLQGSFPLISMSFADVKGNTFHSARMGIIRKLVKLYSEFSYLRTSTVLSEKDTAYFDSVNAEMEDDMAVVAINYMSDYLSRYYGKKVILLLDEYDTPLQEAYVNGYWEEMSAFIRSLFNSTFKTNPYMERGLMTGITRVSKESIFSDLNNLEVVTTTSVKYEKAFGFTEEEVAAALKEFDLSETIEKVKFWYDGFCFGNQTDIYNPWSITKYLDTGKFGNYWAPEDYHLQVAGSRQMSASSHLARCLRENTSSNNLIGKLIRESTADVKIAVEALLRGEQIETAIDEEIVFNQLNQSDTAIWSLLLASGYLKVEDVTNEEDEPTYYLSITNLEVKKTFRKIIRSWFEQSSAKYNDFVKAMLKNDVAYMNHFMNQMTEAVFSFFDTGKQNRSEPEKFYHGFVLGLIADTNIHYVISSNRESGFGRYDVILEPRNPSADAYVLEFKVHNQEREATLEDTVKAALAQIEEKDYDAALLARGIPKEKIHHYGFAFEGKRVLIGSLSSLAKAGFDGVKS